MLINANLYRFMQIKYILIGRMETKNTKKEISTLVSRGWGKEKAQFLRKFFLLVALCICSNQLLFFSFFFVRYKSVKIR